MTASEGLIVSGYAYGKQTTKLGNFIVQSELRKDHSRPYIGRDGRAIRHRELQDVVDKVVLLFCGHGEGFE